MKVFRIIEDLGAEPEIKELGNPGIKEKDKQQDEKQQSSRRKQEEDSGD